MSVSAGFAAAREAAARAAELEVTPLDRLEMLCDPGSLSLIRSSVLSDAMGEQGHSAATAAGSTARSKLSGRVPQISVVSGLSAGGGAYSPALTDWVVMTESSSMFLTGPARA